MKSQQWILAIVLALVFIVLGGLREIVFVNINEQIFFNQGKIDIYRVLNSFHFLGDYDNATLSTFKWILTILFSSTYLILSLIVLRYVLRDKPGLKWLLIAYLVVFILAGSSYIFGSISGNHQLGYTLSRRFMGALQSPFILMLMIPARMLVPTHPDQ